MKVIIAGSRTFNDYILLKEKCDHYLSNIEVPVEIVSGTARGADKLGELYAIDKGFELKRFPADWENNGKGAGMIRNKQMAEYADALIVFWDGHSKGTQHMIDTAKKLNLKIKIVKI